MNNLKFSIIMASFNSEDNILKAIKSIKEQSYENYEIIFVDGLSTDNTLQVIEKNKPHNSHVISEKDLGIADAWNKGLQRCSGDIIGILNSDDYYDKNVFKNILSFFVSENEPFIGYGDVTWVDKDYLKVKKIIGKYNSKIKLLLYFGFMHPSVFFSKEVIKINGNFTLSKNIGMDTDWLLRARHLGIPFKRIPSHTFMKEGGISDKYKYAAMGEYMDSLTRYGFKDYHMIIFFFLRLAAHIIRFLMKPFFYIRNKLTLK